jgi:hypothetical protein
MSGRAQAIKLFVDHEDGYFLTAVPMVAYLLQYLDGRITTHGLHFQVHIVEPQGFLRDINNWV